MIGLFMALQTSAPVAPPPPIEALPVASAGLATRVTLDATGAITDCATEVHGMQGPIDGCLLFAKPSMLVGLLGRPLEGLAWAAVRLDGEPEGAPAAAPAGVDRRILAAATVTVSPDGTIARCAPAPLPDGAPLFDLCTLMPKGGAMFTPVPGGSGVRTLRIRFAVESEAA